MIQGHHRHVLDRSSHSILIAIAAVAMSFALADIRAQLANEPPDLAAYRRIRDEGSIRSQVMEYATQLVDGIGPRLTGSPNLKRATAWALDRLTQIGLSNVRTESWGEFGMGWTERHVSLRMIEPDTATFIARAAPWSPATQGIVTAEVVAVHGFNDEEGFDPYRGRLRGKIVLLGHAASPPEIYPIDRPLFERLDEKKIARLVHDSVPAHEKTAREWEQASAAAEFFEHAGRLLTAEGARAVIVPSGNNPEGGASGGTIYADTNSTFGWFVYQKAHVMPLPLVIISIEHYGRMRRLLERNVRVTLELKVDTEFSGDHEEGANLFADIPAVDLRHKDEIVIVGAHLDSWAAGTGATDDGAGVVIAMEAMRILNAIGIKPKRTIRLALWTGEEQGMLGSMAYVKRHIATIPIADTPEQLRMPEFLRRTIGPAAPKPDHSRISAVYNIDAGGGKIRAVAAGSEALVPVFQPWIEPLRDLGVAAVSGRPYCAGDCVSFERVGIPTPGFNQDPLDYETRTHHTNMDTYEHLIPGDLRQAAIVAATMLHNTAMREEMLPRTGLPH